MNRLSFGPAYATTAADRNARMANRLRSQGPSQEAPGGSSRVGDSLWYGDRVSHVAFREVNVELGAGAHSTRNDVTLQHEITGANIDLMDVDNEVLESYATIDEVGESRIDRGACCDGHVVESGQRVVPRHHVATASHPPPPQVPGRSSPRHDYPSACEESFRLPRPASAGQMSKTEIAVVREMLNKINVVDGTDELGLVNFLKNLSPVFQIAPNCSQEIIKLLIPKVTGQMFSLCVEAVAAQVEWDDLHNEILSRFIPPLRRREIASFELDRPQTPNETYAEYVEHLVSVAFALKTSLSESEVIEIAIRKCRPEIRSHFVFGQLPTSISQLRSFANSVTSSVRAELRYFGGPPTGFQGGNFQHTRNSRANPPMANDFRNKPREKITKCFRCQQEGHIARNCKVALN